MATLIGLATSALFAFLLLNLTPHLQIPLIWQFAIVFCIGAVNLLFWYRQPPSPMSLAEATKACLIGTLLLSGVAVLDTLFGFLIGAGHTIPEAFINSGGFGGPADIFLFVMGLTIGVPTLVKAVCLRYFLGHTRI